MVVALATGCVTDLSASLNGATLVGINDSGVLLANRDSNTVLRIGSEGTATTLATPPGTTNVSGKSINNDGTVLGLGQSFTSVSGPITSYPVVWDRDGTPLTLPAVLDRRATPGSVVWPLGLTDTRLVLGYVADRASADPSVVTFRYFVWHLDGGAVFFLPEPANGSTYAVINDGGTIAGWNTARQSFRITPQTDGSYTTAGYGLLPVSPGAINQAGDIAGAIGPDYRVLGVLHNGAPTPTPLADPGLPAGEIGPQLFLNDKGTIVVTRRLGFGPTGTPVRYTSPTTSVPFEGLNGSTETQVLDLNNNGRAVGLTIGTDGVRRPFSWT
jgi:hypothetical protein